MNIIQDIEGATLLAIGAFCAAAVTSIVLHSASYVMPAEQVVASQKVIALPPVMVVGKRLSLAEKNAQAHIAG